jgi:hypothetical protein
MIMSIPGAPYLVAAVNRDRQKLEAQRPLVEKDPSSLRLVRFFGREAVQSDEPVVLSPRPFRFDRWYAFVLGDGDEEGFAFFVHPLGPSLMPCGAGDLKAVLSVRTQAKESSRQARAPLHLVRFMQTETLWERGPQ